MKEQILQLCRRINCFTLDKLETITELERSELLPVLNELVSDGTISESNEQYFYVKKVPEIQKHSLFQYYNSNIKSFVADFSILCLDLSFSSLLTFVGMLNSTP